MQQHCLRWVKKTPKLYSDSSLADLPKNRGCWRGGIRWITFDRVASGQISGTKRGKPNFEEFYLLNRILVQSELSVCGDASRVDLVSPQVFILEEMSLV